MDANREEAASQSEVFDILSMTPGLDDLHRRRIPIRVHWRPLNEAATRQSFGFLGLGDNPKA